MNLNPICPYCSNKSKFVNGNVIYPNQPHLKSKQFYHCKPCNAYVGVHEGTKKPYGTLANHELRKMRNKAHSAFDPLWKQKIFKNRNSAYSWLSHSLHIDKSKCHIGMFDVEMCQRVFDISTYKSQSGKDYPTSLKMWHHFVYLFNNKIKENSSLEELEQIQLKIDKHKNNYLNIK